MKYKEFTKILKRNGWWLLRQAKGSHEIWAKDNSELVVPNHGSKELSQYFNNIAKKIKEHKYDI